MYVTESIKWIGVNDRKIDLFEGQYKVERGMVLFPFCQTSLNLLILNIPLAVASLQNRWSVTDVKCEHGIEQRLSCLGWSGDHQYINITIYLPGWQNRNMQWT